jgi:4,5-DOPA dioxygenase extradiol
MPVLFIGHGSPMNALGGNAYAAHLARLGRELPRPTAIVSVSAHWVTQGTEVLDTAQPKTIHDFYGFPPELYQMTYPAPGAPLAGQIAGLLEGFQAKTTAEWGLDHGTWTVLRHMYPAADIPVLQVSLAAGLSLPQHVEIGAALAPLRQQGVLILGSGNITHNLRDTDRSASPKPMGWAVEFDQLVARALQNRDTESLTDPSRFGIGLWRQAHPSLEHYLPLLYILGAGGNDPLTFPYQEMQLGSLSMRSVQIG